MASAMVSEVVLHDVVCMCEGTSAHQSQLTSASSSIEVNNQLEAEMLDDEIEVTDTGGPTKKAKRAKVGGCSWKYVLTEVTRSIKLILGPSESDYVIFEPGFYFSGFGGSDHSCGLTNLREFTDDTEDDGMFDERQPDSGLGRAIKVCRTISNSVGLQDVRSHSLPARLR